MIAKNTLVFEATVGMNQNITASYQKQKNTYINPNNSATVGRKSNPLSHSLDRPLSHKDARKLISDPHRDEVIEILN